MLRDGIRDSPGQESREQQEEVDFPPEMRVSTALAVVNVRGKSKRQETVNFCALQPRKSYTHVHVHTVAK